MLVSIGCKYKSKFSILLNLIVEAVVVHYYMTVNATVLGSIPTHKNELLFIHSFIFSLWLQQKRAALSSAIQHAMPHPVESEERNVLTLGSLCPTICRIEREAVKKIFNLTLDFSFKLNIFFSFTLYPVCSRVGIDYFSPPNFGGIAC